MIVEQRHLRQATATWLIRLAALFYITRKPAAPLLPRKGLRLIAPTAAARQRVLDDDELQRVWFASAKLAAKSRCFARLLILIPCRGSEPAGIAMGELDLEAGRWRGPSLRSYDDRRPVHRVLVRA
jgi:integrase